MGLLLLTITPPPSPPYVGASTGIGNHAVKFLATEHPAVVVYAGVRKDADFEALQAEGLANLRCVCAFG